jgi:hypothetical protein
LKQQKQQVRYDKNKMTVIELSAGKKHTIRVGDQSKEITLRPGEVRYEPFLREVMDIPKVERPTLPSAPRVTGKPLPYTPRKAGPPTTLPYTPRVTPPVTPIVTTKTYESWSRARPKPTFDDIISLVEGARGRKDLGFKPTVDNLVSLLKKFRKKP